MGSIVSLLMSLRMMIGVPLLGSIIKPLILTSISIEYSTLRLKLFQNLPVETMRLCLCHTNLQNLPYQFLTPCEIDDFMAGRVPLLVFFGSLSLNLSPHLQHLIQTNP